MNVTKFESNVHDTIQAGNSLHGHYVVHNVDVFNQIEGLWTVYQTGCGYLHNDYDCPDPELALSVGTDDALSKISAFSRSEIVEMSTDDLADLIDELDNSMMLSRESIIEFKDALDQNLIAAQSYFGAITK